MKPIVVLWLTHELMSMPKEWRLLCPPMHGFMFIIVSCSHLHNREHPHKGHTIYSQTHIKYVGRYAMTSSHKEALGGISTCLLS